MKVGVRVRVVQPVIEGEVKERRINPVTDDIEVRIEWTEGGQIVSRWFDQDQLEETK